MKPKRETYGTRRRSTYSPGEALGLVMRRWEINPVSAICPKCGYAHLFMIEAWHNDITKEPDRLWICLTCKCLFERKDLITGLL